MPITKKFAFLDNIKGVPKGDFNEAVTAVLSKNIEGGFVNDPDDPGGPTNHGMSLVEVQRLDADEKLREFIRAHFDVNHDGVIDIADVKDWTDEDAREFYHEFYWKPVRGSDLPRPLAIIVFDSAVNEGVQKAATHLQRSIGGISVDGIIGDETVEAAWGWRIEEGGFRPEEEVFLSRLNRYSTLTKAPKFFPGWARRSFRMLKLAQS